MQLLGAAKTYVCPPTFHIGGEGRRPSSPPLSILCIFYEKCLMASSLVAFLAPYMNVCLVFTPGNPPIIFPPLAVPLWYFVATFILPLLPPDVFTGNHEDPLVVLLLD